MVLSAWLVARSNIVGVARFLHYMCGIKVVHRTARNAPGAGDLRDMKAITNNAIRAKRYMALREAPMGNRTIANQPRYFSVKPVLLSKSRGSMTMNPTPDGGRHVVNKEDMRHGDCSRGVGNLEDHPMQWSPPKMVANKSARRKATLRSLAVNVPQ